MDAYPQGGISATDPNAGSMKTKFVIPTIQNLKRIIMDLQNLML